MNSVGKIVLFIVGPTGGRGRGGCDKSPTTHRRLGAEGNESVKTHRDSESTLDSIWTEGPTRSFLDSGSVCWNPKERVTDGLELDSMKSWLWSWTIEREQQQFQDCQESGRIRMQLALFRFWVPEGNTMVAELTIRLESQGPSRLIHWQVPHDCDSDFKVWDPRKWLHKFERLIFSYTPPRNHRFALVPFKWIKLWAWGN